MSLNYMQMVINGNLAINHASLCCPASLDIFWEVLYTLAKGLLNGISCGFICSSLSISFASFSVFFIP